MTRGAKEAAAVLVALGPSMLFGGCRPSDASVNQTKPISSIGSATSSAWEAVAAPQVSCNGQPAFQLPTPITGEVSTIIVAFTEQSPHDCTLGGNEGPAAIVVRDSATPQDAAELARQDIASLAGVSPSQVNAAVYILPNK